MLHSRRVSLPLAGLTALSIIACGAAAFYYMASPPPPSTSDSVARELKATRDQLKEFSPAAIAQLEAQKAAAEQRLGSAAQFNRWIQTLGTNWIPQTIGSPTSSTLLFQRYSLTYRNPRFRDWNDILSGIRALESRPGVSIQILAISGPNQQRRTFEQVKIEFSVALRPKQASESPTAAPPAGEKS